MEARKGEEIMEAILEVHNLKKYFKMKDGILRAVDDVSFSIYEGETLGIVGESGCGKTTCGRTCIGMYKKTGGHVKYRGEEVEVLRKKDKKKFAQNVQCVFQDPYSSLDPRMKVSSILAEGIEAHHLADTQKNRDDMVV